MTFSHPSCPWIIKSLITVTTWKLINFSVSPRDGTIFKYLSESGAISDGDEATVVFLGYQKTVILQTALKQSRNLFFTKKKVKAQASMIK